MYIDDILLIGNDIPTLQEVKMLAWKVFCYEGSGRGYLYYGDKDSEIHE